MITKLPVLQITISCLNYKTQIYEPSNQNSIKVPKVVKPTNKTLGTSVINSPLFQSPLLTQSFTAELPDNYDDMEQLALMGRDAMVANGGQEYEVSLYYWNIQF